MLAIGFLLFLRAISLSHFLSKSRMCMQGSQIVLAYLFGYRRRIHQWLVMLHKTSAARRSSFVGVYASRYGPAIKCEPWKICTI